ncbi:TetR/AcrR family transcriptional regulator [Gordonia sp. CPCC 206044]|uniref:TetR/AcrR family transcriptional regulator n=1 Tax=Gordonia sp. CPCC 206044 TaxID=3140793 RepID=UPI003AF390EB
MTDPSPSVRVRAGRPTRAQAEARHEQLLDAALDLFLELGFEQATIEMIAAQVGMNRRTVYARYTDKAALFRAAAQRAIERQVVPPETLADLDEGDLAGSLEAVARLRVGQVMTPEGLRLQRIINTESFRFPDILSAYYTQSTKPVIDFVAGLFDRAVSTGSIAPTDTALAAQTFMSMVVSGWVRRIVSGREPTPAEFEKRVQFTVDLLLNGLLPR